MAAQQPNVKRYNRGVSVNSVLNQGYVISKGSQTITVYEYDKNGDIVKATGTAAASTQNSLAGYAKGATYIDTDVATGLKALYENIGTSSSSSWNLIGDVTAGEITLATNNLLAGSSTGVAEAVTDITLPKEGARTISVATTTTAATAGAALAVKAAAGATTGAGGAISVVGGASGNGATGNGGATSVTGGAALSTNGNGGDVVLAGGAGTGTGVSGSIMVRSLASVKQLTQTAKTTSATLTTIEIFSGIITVNQGAGGTSALQLPLATSMDTDFASFTTNDAIDISVINISTVDAEDASITTNTGWTLVGSMDIPANNGSSVTNNCSARLRLRKTGVGTWTAYRIA